MPLSLMRIRLPLDLKTKLQETADINDRSMNAELLQILKAHFSSRVSGSKTALKGSSAHGN